MPNGKRHATATLVVASCSFLTLALVCDVPTAIFTSLGCLAGLVLSCDLDVQAGSRSNHYVRKFAGIVVAALWKTIWMPYAWAIPHRSVWSHGPIISTAIRLLYLGFLPAAFWWWAGWPLPRLETWMMWAVLGLVAADCTHALLDWCDSKLGGRL